MPQSTFIYLTYGPNKEHTDDRIHSYGFDQFGRIGKVDRGAGKAADMDFTYDNLQGWLKQIKSNGGFEQNLYRGSEGMNPTWNGSIAAMSWRYGNEPLRCYDYTYDGLNRLTDASFGAYKQTSATSTTMQLIPSTDGRSEDYSASYQYDKNSNLLEFERRGWAYVDAEGNDIYDTVDDVAIDYDGNQRKSAKSYIKDGVDYYGKFAFADGSHEDVEYAYNASGALIKDLNKGIRTITYDELGHPKNVTFENRNWIQYVYAADGRKLREIRSVFFNDSYANGHKDTIDYINTYVFKNGKPVMYKFQDGYYSFDENGKLDGCHLYVNDYLGNVRMVVNAHTDSIEQINHYYPYGALIGNISTNPDMQNYKYSGKELNRSFGLDWYDFHARQYDPLIPVFNSIDPMVEKDYGISPYAYCGGDPINYVDKSGKERYAVNSQGYIIFVGSDGNDFITLFNTQNPEQTFVVPKELNSVIEDMAEKRNKNAKNFAKGSYTLKKCIDYQSRKTHYSITNSPKIYSLYAWLLNCKTDVEWRVDGYKSKKEYRFVIGTQHSGNPQLGIDNLDRIENVAELLKKGFRKITNTHNHTLDGTLGGSYYKEQEQGDMVVCKDDIDVRYFVAIPQEGDKPFLLFQYSNINGVMENKQIEGGFSLENLSLHFGITF